MNIREKLSVKHNVVTQKFRDERFNLFQRVMSPNPEMSILDVGGVGSTWIGSGLETSVTLLNLTSPSSKDRERGFKTVKGNALNMHMFEYGQFDIVFSNSVIEHVGSYNHQKQFASEVKRVGKRYWVQTPNLHFPIEPHFLLPLFQYFPNRVQKVFGVVWPLSNYKKYGLDRGRILQEINDLRLLCEDEIKSLFPGAKLYHEKVLGLTKSFVVYK